ncbi:MarR family transcriptional regulator [Streptomyces sp. NPDC005784]|uniref:MarR family winged helix-turn-helix transcriptional regulator n=1 Tax=Streptomyces sp. NPDC005784 TaxID=3364731 RepID=UPI003692D686
MSDGDPAADGVPTTDRAAPADAGRAEAGRADAAPADTGRVHVAPAHAGPADTRPVGTAPADEGHTDASPADTVAAVVRQWETVRPDLDTGPMEVIGRVNRCAALLQQAEDAPLRRAGLTRPEFDVLGTLRRTGHELTPSEIARETFSSGAAVTKRLKQLTERGLVERRGDTRDRRVAHVRLTDAGRDLVDGVLPDQLAYETGVLSGIGRERQRELAGLLGELLGQLEGRLRLPRT